MEMPEDWQTNVPRIVQIVGFMVFVSVLHDFLKQYNLLNIFIGIFVAHPVMMALKRMTESLRDNRMVWFLVFVLTLPLDCYLMYCFISVLLVPFKVLAMVITTIINYFK